MLFNVCAPPFSNQFVIIFSKLGETGPEGGQAESTPTPTLALFANNTEKENKTTDAPATGTEKVTEAPVVTEEPAPTPQLFNTNDLKPHQVETSISFEDTSPISNNQESNDEEFELPMLKKDVVKNDNSTFKLDGFENETFQIK